MSERAIMTMSRFPPVKHFLASVLHVFFLSFSRLCRVCGCCPFYVYRNSTVILSLPATCSSACALCSPGMMLYIAKLLHITEVAVLRKFSSTVKGIVVYITREMLSSSECVTAHPIETWKVLPIPRLLEIASLIAHVFHMEGSVHDPTCGVR